MATLTLEQWTIKQHFQPFSVATSATSLANEKGEGEKDYVLGDQVGQDEQEQRVVEELFNITNWGSSIKATNDPITTQQGDH